MKKIVILLFLAISLCCKAQHFQFMGITIDGSIESFTKKLNGKGFVSSKRFPVLDTKSEKWLDGRYAGYDVSLLIQSTPKSNLVWSVTVIRYVDSEEEAKQMCGYIQGAIEEKYQVDKKIVQDTNSTRYEVGVGDIVFAYHKDDLNYRVNIMYFDIDNNTKWKNENKDDI